MTKERVRDFLLGEDGQPLSQTAGRDRSALDAYLLPRDRDYHADVRLFGQLSGNPWWMSHIPEGRPVHAMLENLNYALALLESGEPHRVARAQDVLCRVIDGQDADPVSASYGAWSRYVEEPIRSVPTPERHGPDFEAAVIAHVLVEHAAKLSPGTLRRAREAMSRAGGAIFRRNVGIAYSNFAIMGACDTLVAGEVLGDARLFEYGRRKLAAMVAHVAHHGGFTEWNSPTYTRVVLNECERILQLVRDPDGIGTRADAEKLRREVWEEIAYYFHPGTQQWAGPHSRAYSDRLTPDAVADLRAMIGVDIRLHPSMGSATPPGWSPLRRHPCPADLVERFRRLPKDEMTVSRMLIKGDPGEQDFRSTTWFVEDACLGSVNIEDLWFQRRTVLGYWRTPEDPAVVLRVRFLHDDYDFSSAYARNAQDGPRVLTSFGLLTDMGDRIAHLDRPADGLFSAEDFRVRYELIGAGVSARELSGGRYELSAGDWKAIVHARGGRFGPNDVTWQLGRAEGRVFVDGVCYHGARRKFDLAQVGEVAIAGGLEVLRKDEAPAETSPELAVGRPRDGWYTVLWPVAGGLSVSGPLDAIAYPGYKGGDKPRRKS
jgi:hypothetical protein